MIFSSATFLYLFLPGTLIFYYGILRGKRFLQNIFLTFASLFFYAWGEPVYVFLMLLSIFINWLFGLSIEKNRMENQKVAKRVLLLSVFSNLLILFVFKYLNFTVSILNLFISSEVSIPEIVLPIGISFFTFQAMSYVIDIYRGYGKAQKNILNVGLYISFFPQLIAGPIVRYETIAYEIEHRKETSEDFFSGFSRFVIGLGKKVILANNLAVFAEYAFQSVSELTVLESWLGALCFAFQIYFDFSGYSDMAIGMGQMFGFHFLENFNYPYISKSITEFWRRWHMSLGTWFRDYVYIPLGGSRVSKSRLIINLFVVWFLTGVWHGANWTFILWGLMYYFLLVFEKLTNFHKNSDNKLVTLLKWLYTMIFVLLGWVLFNSNSVGEAFIYMRVMFGFVANNSLDKLELSRILQTLPVLLAATVLSTPVFRSIDRKYRNNTVWEVVYACSLVLIFIFSVISVISNSHNPFIYFNF